MKRDETIRAVTMWKPTLTGSEDGTPRYRCPFCTNSKTYTQAEVRQLLYCPNCKRRMH